MDPRTHTPTRTCLSTAWRRGRDVEAEGRDGNALAWWAHAGGSGGPLGGVRGRPAAGTAAWARATFRRAVGAFDRDRGSNAQGARARRDRRCGARAEKKTDARRPLTWAASHTARVARRRRGGVWRGSGRRQRSCKARFPYEWADWPLTACVEKARDGPREGPRGARPRQQQQRPWTKAPHNTAPAKAAATRRRSTW